MPLLPSTQTKTANGVPLYVPMDGEGNASVPSSLTVNGGILSTFLPDGSVFTGASGGFPSIQFTNPASSIPSTLIGLQDSGTLLVGNNSVRVGMTGALNVGGLLTLPTLPSGNGIAGCTFMQIGQFGFMWGDLNTTGSGTQQITLPTGRTGTLVGGSVTPQLDISGGNNFMGAIGGVTNGVNVAAAYPAAGNLVPSAGVFFIAVFLMSN